MAIKWIEIKGEIFFH